MTKRFYKHKLLFDENMLLRTAFHELNEHCDVKHVDHDLRRRGASDPEVYALGQRLGRIIITLNVRHFKDLVGTKEAAGVIGIPPHWPTSRIDSTLSALLMRHGASYFAGRLVPLESVVGERKAA